MTWAILLVAVCFLVALNVAAVSGGQADSGALTGDTSRVTFTGPDPPADYVLRSDYDRVVRKWHKQRALKVVRERQRNRLRDAVRSSVRLGASGLERGFLCIHHFEGSWHAATGNGFYGGLQMDYGFMRSYGGDFLRAFGTANNWTPAMQLAVAERAHLSGRGYGPWPNTRKACGI